MSVRDNHSQRITWRDEELPAADHVASELRIAISASKRSPSPFWEIYLRHLLLPAPSYGHYDLDKPIYALKKISIASGRSASPSAAAPKQGIGLPVSTLWPSLLSPMSRTSSTA